MFADTLTKMNAIIAHRKSRSNVGGELKVSGTNGGSLSRISVFLVIIGGFRCRLTKLLLKAVLVLFYGKSGIFQFIRALLSMRECSTHQSLKESPFVSGTIFGELGIILGTFTYLGN